MKRTTRHNWERFEVIEGTERVRWIFDAEKARAEFEKTEVVDGVLRWKSSGNIPPRSCLEDFLEVGCEFDLERTLAADAAHLAELVQKMRDRKPSEEELFEMRAEFGRGATVVNVLTGRRIRL